MTEVTDKDRSIAGFVAHIVAAHNGKTSEQLENYIARVQMMATEKATKEAAERADKWAWGECIMVRQRESLGAAIMDGKK